LMINATHFTPVDEGLIPAGKIQPVADTPLDFRKAKLIGEERRADHPYIEHACGYDHNFVLNRHDKQSLQLAARAEEAISGRSIEIYTTDPGLQLYVCEHPVEGIDSAFCLEPQHFPDSPNHPQFPSTVLEAFESYRWEMAVALN